MAVDADQNHDAAAHPLPQRSSATAPDDLTAWDLSVVRPRRGRLRLWSGVVLAGCAFVLTIAALVHPDPAGIGTKSQFGLGTCGMYKLTGLPCPTCGMTTAFANTVRGHFVRAFFAQPTGLILAIATMLVALGAGWSLVTGRLPPIRVPIITPYRLLFILLVLLLGGWAFKMVEILTQRA